jgi:hypothetical protein
METQCSLNQHSALTVMILNIYIYICVCVCVCVWRGGVSPKIQTNGQEKSLETETKMAELKLSCKTVTGSVI